MQPVRLLGWVDGAVGSSVKAGGGEVDGFDGSVVQRLV